MENQTTVTYFILLGFSYNRPIQILLFLVFLFMYIITLMGNMIIMVVVKNDSQLQSPMYLFLSQLSFLDICYSSVTVPKMLANFFTNHTISYASCIAQMFFIILTGCTEIFLLTAMAYDRYAAICNPLHYVETMNMPFCKQLVGGAWTVGFIHAFVNTLPVLKLVFCGPNTITHFSCELPSLLRLSCTETFTSSLTFLVTSSAVVLFSLCVILVSYTHIVSLVLKIDSAEAKRKTFSTCSSHLIVVVLFYGTACFRYLRPSSASSVVLDELFSVQYSISTPMLNPIIYSLKTQDVKEAIKKLLRNKSLISSVS